VECVPSENTLGLIWTTDEACSGTVVCEGKSIAFNDKNSVHYATISDLQLNKSYHVQISCYSPSGQSEYNNVYKTQPAHQALIGQYGADMINAIRNETNSDDFTTGSANMRLLSVLELKKTQSRLRQIEELKAILNEKLLEFQAMGKSSLSQNGAADQKALISQKDLPEVQAADATLLNQIMIKENIRQINLAKLKFQEEVTQLEQKREKLGKILGNHGSSK
jgi:hypothetical protein